MPRINHFSEKGLDGKGRSKEEINTILKRMRQPSYQRINRGLTLDSTPIEKAKYEVCQNILRYRRENNLTEKGLVQKTGIKPEKSNALLFCHIEEFTLDELVLYASELFSPFQIGIIEAKNRENLNKQKKSNKIYQTASS